MFRKSMMVIPLIRYCRAPTFVQGARNFRDIRSDFRSIMHDIERQFEYLEGMFPRSNPLRIITSRFIPIKGEVDPDSYRLNIDVEGFKPEDIKLSLKEGVLKIEANMDKKAEDGSRFQQSIVREYTLPSNVDPSTLKSILHDHGILTIEATLNNTNQPKNIPIHHLGNGDTKE